MYDVFKFNERALNINKSTSYLENKLTSYIDKYLNIYLVDTDKE
jgi:hypothetical protein